MNTLEQFTQAHFKLAPQGMAMPTYADDSNLKKLFQNAGRQLKNAETAADAVADEIMPDSSGAFLADWERVLGLPLSGLGTLKGAQRLAFIETWLYAGELSNAQFFIDIAALAGYTITVTEFTPDDPPPAPADPDDAYLYFQINYPATTALYFRAGTSRAGDRLVEYGNDALIFIIKYFKPAHAKVLFNQI
jgi:uncharacterized protein YmfQ (DUF2313 family)